jgi:hypothetical protein
MVYLGYLVCSNTVNKFLTMSIQVEQLYVSDLTALSHIFVKDQVIYEETPMFIELVVFFSIPVNCLMESLRGNELIFGQGLLSTSGKVYL